MDRAELEKAAKRHGWTVAPAANDHTVEVEYHLTTSGTAPGREWSIDAHLPVEAVEAVEAKDRDAVLGLFEAGNRRREALLASLPDEHPEAERMAEFRRLVDEGLPEWTAAEQVWPDQPSGRPQYVELVLPGNDSPGSTHQG